MYSALLKITARADVPSVKRKMVFPVLLETHSSRGDVSYGPTCAALPAGSPSAQLCGGPQRAAPPGGSLPPRLCVGPQRAAPPPGPPASPRSSADTAALSRPAAAAPRPGSSPPPAGPHAAAASPPGPAGETHPDTFTHTNRDKYIHVSNVFTQPKSILRSSILQNAFQFCYLRAIASSHLIQMLK